MASTYVLVMGSIIGALAWTFLAFKVPGLPFGRTLGTFGCAVLALVFAVLSPADAFAAINLETLSLLLGTMIISVLLEREGFFALFVHALTFRCSSAFSLLARLCVASAILSALTVNDTVCVFLTPVVVELCELHQLPHGPFLIALATSANIGSTATPVGNPQNMVIAAMSGISYGQFIVYIGPAMLVALALNVALLMAWYGKALRGRELRVCRGRFVRATEEEMEARLGKDWEKEVAMEREREQRRVQRREREKRQTDGLPSPAALPSARGDGEEYEEELDEASSVKRRKGADLPTFHADVDDDSKVPSLPLSEHRVEIADGALPPVGAAQQAQVMVAHGERDEDAKHTRDAEKRHDAEEKADTVAAVNTSDQLASTKESLSPSTSARTPPLLHADSVALLIYQLQLEHRAILQDEETSKKGSAPVDGVAEEDLEPLMRRRTRTRVADYHHPRKTGRTLIQLPPELSSTALARLQTRHWRRRMRDAWRAAKAETAAGVANGAVKAEDSASLLAPSEVPSSPLSFLQPLLPTAVYTRLLLTPLPSKLVLFFLCLLGTVGAFAGGANLGWSALGGACAMLVIDWREPDSVIGLVDWSLLVFFGSLFVVTQAFQATGLPLDVWSALQGTIDVDTVVGLVVYSLIVLVGSNTVSNVPLVLLLGPSIPALSNPFESWLLLSFVSTVAGNLTLVGSVANLIVASRAKAWYTLTFWEYARFGFPTTLLVTVVGVLVVKGMSTLG